MENCNDDCPSLHTGSRTTDRRISGRRHPRPTPGRQNHARARTRRRLAALDYLDLESPEDSSKLDDAAAFFEAHRDGLVILDEVQRRPALFAQLRGVIDQRRRAGRRHGQFLLLGSATGTLLQQSAESLAGRIAVRASRRFVVHSGQDSYPQSQGVRATTLTGLQQALVALGSSAGA